MLDIRELSVKQGSFTLSADLSFKFGDRIAIVGPSGGGKSTLLLTIAGFLELSSGSIWFNSKRIDGTAPVHMPCSMLFQDNNLFPHLNVVENVGLGIKPSLRLNPSERELVFSALKKMDLENKALSKISELSGGQISRVALARSLLRKKPVLILDEPFEALGPAQRLEMINYVAEFLKGYNSILLMVTHNPLDAKKIANKIVFIQEGVVSDPKDTKAFFKEPDLEIKKYLGKNYY
ncbi:MAG: ATP-binding cassette domain-containing protein [Pseudomonadota bacterium]|nr:ATP-binding cassette domain-containing protein [Pseudomonadota bacterium]